MKNRVERLSYLITLLSKGVYINTPNIAKELKVSRKIIQSDFKLYILPYFEGKIYYDYRDKCYKSKDFMLSSFAFSAKELAVICILFAKSRDKYNDDNFHPQVKALFHKFENLASHEIYKVSQLEKIDEFKDETMMINFAIEHNQEIECIYRDKKRRLQPLKILNFDDFWYLINYDTYYKDIRKYHLNSIKNIKLLESFFTPKKEEIKKFDNAINAWFKVEIEPYIVSLHVESRIARYFKRKPISKTQKITRKYDDGSMEIELYVTDDMEIIPTIQRFLPFIKVIKPERIGRKIEEHFTHIV